MKQKSNRMIFIIFLFIILITLPNSFPIIQAQLNIKPVNLFQEQIPSFFNVKEIKSFQLNDRIANRKLSTIETDTNLGLPDLIAGNYFHSGFSVTEGELYYKHPTIKNIGEGRSGSCYVKIMISPNNDWDTSDDIFFSRGIVNPLNPGEEVCIELPSRPFPKVGSLSGNSYQIWTITVVDSSNEIEESDENNIFKSNNPTTVSLCKNVTSFPSLINPTDEQEITSPIEFRWDIIACASFYGIYIKRTADNRVIVNNDFVEGTSYLGILEPGEYTWNVRAGNDFGWGPLSSDHKLIVVDKENPPVTPIDIIIELWIGNRIALVDGKPISLDTVPIIVQGRTLVPLRFIAEAFKADVFYESQEQKIEIIFKGLDISLWINKTKARIETTENGEKRNRIVTLDAPPIIRSGRTLVPVRFIADAFGATTDWDRYEEKITIVLKE